MRGDHGAGPALRRIADPEQMEAVFAELAADLAPVYRRRDLRANGVLYLRGLLMPGVAGNCWSIAEAVGLDRPYRPHHSPPMGLTGHLWSSWTIPTGAVKENGTPVGVEQRSFDAVAPWAFLGRCSAGRSRTDGCTAAREQCRAMTAMISLFNEDPISPALLLSNVERVAAGSDPV
ncbi:hypothetical protein QFZ22_001145 [Streptomyces canus]|uniref:Uncharacterized protein n=1 Tax=Streptomyces canus TaxID=58343 RepID=A0AAW8F705_9ACTN|nr:hypothetical protein [Streptomyces canus]MDQ0905160.1 hypothetical protein [Streptomyces canus]